MSKRITMLGITFALIVAMAVPAYAASAPFSDVPTTAPYYTEVMYCKDNGITSGVGNNMFAPNNPVSNFEAATMIVRAFCPDKLVDGSSAMDVCFFNGWIENWNYNNPYGQITMADLINLSLRAKGPHKNNTQPNNTPTDMKLYAAGENGARVAKRSDCAYLIGKLAVNTYTPNWSKLVEKLNISVDKDYVEGAESYYAIASNLPESVISTWDERGNTLRCGYDSLVTYGKLDPITTGFYGVYYGKGIALIDPYVLYHEFGHYVHDVSKFKDLNAKLDACLDKYRDVVNEELGWYYSSSSGEFFAECFGGYMGELMNPMTRAVLKEKMPDMFNLLADMEAANWGL